MVESGHIKYNEPTVDNLVTEPVSQQTEALVIPNETDLASSG